MEVLSAEQAYEAFSKLYELAESRVTLHLADGSVREGYLLDATLDAFLLGHGSPCATSDETVFYTTVDHRRASYWSDDGWCEVSWNALTRAWIRAT